MELSDRDYGRCKRALDQAIVTAKRLEQEGVSVKTASLVRAELLEAEADKTKSTAVSDQLKKAALRIRRNIKE